MAEPAADALPPVPHDTTLSDRDLLVHILQHAESIDDRLATFEQLLTDLGPLIEKAKKHGRGPRLFGSGPPPGGFQG